MTDKTPGACQCHEKHAPTYWKGVVREYKDALEKAESRPLTPDAITDEMVKRAQREEERQCGDWTAPTAMRRILAAALTEPPRPEGAYELETVIGLNAGKWTNGAEDVRALADLLASNGVRVTGGE